MTDQEFRDMLLATLTDIKEQEKERYDRLEKRLDSIEAKARENNERLEKRLDSMDTSVAQLRQDVGWVKGKAESGEADIFLTTDDRLLRRAQRYHARLHIQVKNPETWLREVIENGRFTDDGS